MAYYEYADGYVEDVTATSKWTLENFCINCNDRTEYFDSPTFFANNLRWRLRLYPISSVEEDYVAVSLTLFNKTEVTVNYSLSIINNDNKKFVVAGEKQTYFHQKLSRFCSRFIRRNELMSKKNRLLVNGTLTILCEITVDFESYSDLKKEDMQSQMTKRMKMTENFFDFEEFLLNQKFCDVSFIVGDKKLPAHKVVLSSKSDVFSGIFEANVVGREQVIEITDVDYNVFIEMLRFIYTRTTKDIKDMAKRLFVAANKYGLDDLKSLCADALVKDLSRSNAIEYLSLADRYGLQFLRIKALDFIASNVDGLKNDTK